AGSVPPDGSNSEHGAEVDAQRGEDAEGGDGQAEQVKVGQLHVGEQEREHVLPALITARGRHVVAAEPDPDAWPSQGLTARSAPWHSAGCWRATWQWSLARRRLARGGGGGRALLPGEN